VQAEHIAHLWWFMFGVSVFVFVAVMVAMSLGLARRGERGVEPAEIEPLPPTETPLEKRLGIWVGGSVGATVVLLFVLLVVSISTGSQIAGLHSRNPVSIQVIGHQWWWEVIYPNPQADQTVVTANEIHIPVGVPVVINSTSQDVIHSFWAPQIHGKRDLIPGYQTAVWIEADEPGHFRGQCAEFCGAQHAKMAFSIIAEPAASFQNWLQQQIKPAADSADPEVQHGREVFLTHSCVMCHTVRGTGAGSRVGPDLTHVGSREMIGAETISNTAGNLGGWIADSQGIKPGNKMPPNNIPGDELNALIRYLQSLQ
jgi:cytochrome c oxidase subunit 2